MSGGAREDADDETGAQAFKNVSPLSGGGDAQEDTPASFKDDLKELRQELLRNTDFMKTLFQQEAKEIKLIEQTAKEQQQIVKEQERVQSRSLHLEYDRGGLSL
jgi:hypothetical protein